MRKLLPFIFVLSLSFTVFSCSKEDNIDDIDSLLKKYTWVQYLDNPSKSKIKFHDGNYIQTGSFMDIPYTYTYPYKVNGNILTVFSNDREVKATIYNDKITFHNDNGDLDFFRYEEK